MQKIRIFQSAQNDVQYVNKTPMSVSEFRKLTKEQQEALRAKVQG